MRLWFNMTFGMGRHDEARRQRFSRREPLALRMVQGTHSRHWHGVAPVGGDGHSTGRGDWHGTGSGDRYSRAVHCRHGLGHGLIGRHQHKQAGVADNHSEPRLQADKKIKQPCSNCQPLAMGQRSASTNSTKWPMAQVQRGFCHELRLSKSAKLKVIGLPADLLRGRKLPPKSVDCGRRVAITQFRTTCLLLPKWICPILTQETTIIRHSPTGPQAKLEGKGMPSSSSWFMPLGV